MAILLHASRSLPGGNRLRRSPGLVFQAFDEAGHDVPQFRLPLQAVAIFQSFNRLLPLKQPDDDALPQGSGGRVLDRVATRFIDDLENGVQRFPRCLFLHNWRIRNQVG